jgi:putative DNA primase/helicase
VPHLSFSLIGSTQPGVLSAFVAESSRGESNDGMLQRFGMMVWPDSAEEFEFVDRAVDAQARNTAYAAFDRLDQLDPDDAGAQRSTNFDLPWLPLANDAYQAFKPWRIRFENELRSEKIGSPALEAHLAKHRKLIPVLALIRHLAEGATGPVTLHALESAFAWARYLESHARRIYGSIGYAEARAAKAITARIKGGDLSAPFLAREIIRKHWMGLTDTAVVKGALELMVDANWLHAQIEKTGGRPIERYIINPKAK